MYLRSDSISSFNKDLQTIPAKDEVLTGNSGIRDENLFHQRSYNRPCSLRFSHHMPSSYRVFGSTIARAVVWHLMPSFIRHLPATAIDKKPPNATAYLDGMRGLAAFAVFLCHLSYGTWDCSHVYGAGGLQENRSILQLPIIRLFYAGPPMVAVFFVISGYALSYKPIKLIQMREYDAFSKSISSSLFRRPIRLFLPCLASTLLVVCLYQLGFYKRTEEFGQNMRAISEEHAQTQPDIVLQLRDWIAQMTQFVNVFDWSLYAGSVALDRHLWTIPVEYRCSLALSLTLMVTAHMIPKMRATAMMILMWWGMHWDRWDLLPFWAGALLAEADRDNSSAEDDVCSSKAKPPGSRQKLFQTSIAFLNFTCGLYLASFPDADGHVSPGYIYLNSLIPEYWTEKHRFWPTVGAIQIVWSTPKISYLKNFFASSCLQYLGKISFALYLVHGPVIHTFGYSVMQQMYQYTGTEDRARLGLGFAAAALPTMFFTTWAADVFWRLIDQPCARLAHWLETKIFVT